jgi:hypothetical protein
MLDVRSSFVGIACFFALMGSASGDVIPDDRKIDWSTTGVPGGVPNVTRVCATVDASGDATAAIQAAVDGCETSEPNSSPGPGVVVIPEGTYDLSGTINLGTKSHIVIRGAGANKTILNSAGLAFSFGVNGVVGANIAITAGAEKGSTELTLADASSLQAGQLIDISDDNQPGLVFTNHGSTHDSKQMLLITAVNGNQVTVTPPLIWTFSENPVVLYSFIGLQQFAGLEDMKIDHDGGGSGASFMIDQCYGCWVKGIHSHKPGGYHTYILDSLNGEVRDSFFVDSQSYGSDNAGLNVRGTTNAGENQGAVTAFKFENNIFDKCFPGVEMQNASSGNYVGYNYGHAVQVADYTPGDTYVGWNSGMLNDNHGPHDMMNLYEGNVAEQFISDGYFGSASHGTLFRNHLWGRNPRLEISWNAISLNRWSYHYNVIGNVLGLSDPKQTIYSFATSAECNGGSGIYRLGFPNIGNCDTTSYDGASPPGIDAQVEATLLRWGNYDYANESVRWEASEIPSGVPAPDTQTLPASLVYSGTPAWWISGIPFPPIGPEVTGGNADGSGHANKIPAQVCWETLDLLNGGAFDRAACYSNLASPDGGVGGSGSGGTGTGGGSGGGAASGGGGSGAKSDDGDDGGCGCETRSRPLSPSAIALVALGIAFRCRRRRREDLHADSGGTDRRTPRPRDACGSQARCRTRRPEASVPRDDGNLTRSDEHPASTTRLRDCRCHRFPGFAGWSAHGSACVRSGRRPRPGDRPRGRAFDRRRQSTVR